MRVYIETSAVLRALLERDVELIRALRRVAPESLTSRLTFIELERSLSRATREARLAPKLHREAYRRLRELADNVDIMAMDEAVLTRAAEPFLIEPIRTLDAIHLASILVFARAVGAPLTVLSCDRRVRENSEAYGFEVLPREACP